MSDLVCEAILLRKAAAVVGHPVCPVALHPTVADAAPEHAPQQVRLGSGLPPSDTDRPAAATFEHLLSLHEILHGDDRRVYDVLRPNPVVLLVPAKLGGVAGGHVVYVEKYLVLTLAVPDLVPGVPGVGQDGADRALGPSDSAAVRVACSVVGGGGRNAVARESFCDGEQAAVGQELIEDPSNH